MKLLTRTARPDDVARCADLATDRFLYDAALLRALKALWRDVLVRDVACSCVVFAEDAPREILAFGISVCAAADIADAVRHGCAPFVVRRLLERSNSCRDAVLDERGIAEMNAGDGVDVLALGNGMVQMEDRDITTRLYVEVTHQFLGRHASLNLRCFVHELFGWFPEYIEDLGLNVRAAYPSYEHELEALPRDKLPFVAWVTRADALRRPSLPVNQMFLRFSPPRLGLSAVKRRLLRLALEGESDETACEVLCAAVATTKKWWSDVYDTFRHSDVSSAAARAPGSVGGNGCRGAEMRRHVLAYVREHPEELHPYRSPIFLQK